MCCWKNTPRATSAAPTRSAAAWPARSPRSSRAASSGALGGAFFRAQENGFIPGGRINSAAGTELKATLINCFVQPVGDSISSDGDEVGHLRAP